MAEYWAHHYFDNPNAQDEVVDDDFDLDAEMERIAAEAEGKNPDDWDDLTK